MAFAYSDIDEARKIATITINRPDALNALDVPTAQDLNKAVMPLRERTDLRCIVFKGAGRAFMAGGDLSAFAQDFDKTETVINDLLDALNPVVEFFYFSPVPVLACVHGAVAGAGLSLMSACDLVIAAEGTRFLIAYDKVGAPPDCGGSYFLPRQLGEKRAAALMLLGETWTADQALAFGLINRLAPADQFEAASQQLAEQLASGPSQAFASYKTLVREGVDKSLEEQLEAERQAFCKTTKTADFRTGVSAFLQKKKPDFVGK